MMVMVIQPGTQVVGRWDALELTDRKERRILLSRRV